MINNAKGYVRCVSRPSFVSQQNFLFTDTDSLVYEVYEDFYSDKDLFDFSDYLVLILVTNSKFFDLTNQKVVDKMKDQFCWIKIKDVLIN